MSLSAIVNYNKKELAESLSLGHFTIHRYCDRYNKTRTLREVHFFTDKQAILDYLQDHPDADGIELRNKLTSYVS